MACEVCRHPGNTRATRLRCVHQVASHVRARQLALLRELRDEAAKIRDNLDDPTLDTIMVPASAIGVQAVLRKINDRIAQLQQGEG